MVLLEKPAEVDLGPDRAAAAGSEPGPRRPLKARSPLRGGPLPPDGSSAAVAGRAPGGSAAGTDCRPGPRAAAARVLPCAPLDVGRECSKIEARRAASASTSRPCRATCMALPPSRAGAGRALGHASSAARPEGRGRPPAALAPSAAQARTALDQPGQRSATVPSSPRRCRRPAANGRCLSTGARSCPPHPSRPLRPDAGGSAPPTASSPGACTRMRPDSTSATSAVSTTRSAPPAR